MGPIGIELNNVVNKSKEAVKSRIILNMPKSELNIEVDVSKNTMLMLKIRERRIVKFNKIP
jgi:hypothetical protein